MAVIGAAMAPLLTATSIAAGGAHRVGTGGHFVLPQGPFYSGVRREMSGVNRGPSGSRIDAYVGFSELGAWSGHAMISECNVIVAEELHSLPPGVARVVQLAGGSNTARDRLEGFLDAYMTCMAAGFAANACID